MKTIARVLLTLVLVVAGLRRRLRTLGLLPVLAMDP